MSQFLVTTQRVRYAGQKYPPSTTIVPKTAEDRAWLLDNEIAREPNEVESVALAPLVESDTVAATVEKKDATPKRGRPKKEAAQEDPTLKESADEEATDETLEETVAEDAPELLDE